MAFTATSPARIREGPPCVPGRQRRRRTCRLARRPLPGFQSHAADICRRSDCVRDRQIRQRPVRLARLSRAMDQRHRSGHGSGVHVPRRRDRDPRRDHRRTQARYGAYIVAGWLVGIVINLLTYSGFYDVALRDFGLMLAALARPPRQRLRVAAELTGGAPGEPGRRFSCAHRAVPAREPGLQGCWLPDCLPSASRATQMSSPDCRSWWSGGSVSATHGGAGVACAGSGGRGGPGPDRRQDTRQPGCAARAAARLDAGGAGGRFRASRRRPLSGRIDQSFLSRFACSASESR